MFVATDRTQGRCDNGFHNTDGAELVNLAISCDTDRGDPDSRCR